MKIGLEIRIDMNKIDNSRVFVGQKGAYLSLTTFIDIDEKDQYDNNGFISASLTKEEREQKVRLPILGNSKVFWSDAPPPQYQPQQPQYQQQPVPQQPVPQQPQQAPQYQQAPQQAAPQQPPPQQSFQPPQQAPIQQQPVVNDFDEEIPF